MPSPTESEGAGGPGLLAVDLGPRSGLALFGSEGRLRWYRSRNFGTQSRLKPAVRR
jgi:hypothetical protein